MLTSILKIIFFFVILIFTSCTSINSKNTDKEISKYFAILGPISNGDVTITYKDSNETIYSTKTKTYKNDLSKLKWNSYETGSFNVDLNLSLQSPKWLYVRVTNGEDIDKNDDGIVVFSDIKPLSGKLKLYCKTDDFKSSNVIINIFTTISATLYENENNTTDLESFLNKFAQTIFVKSVDNFSGIDYRDIYAYIPNETNNNVFIHPTLYKNIINSGLLKSVLNDENLSAKLLEDVDSDKLSLWSEILNGSSDTLIDTDSDGINDYVEIQMGLNPASSDSDKDTISDYDELYRYKTDPLNTDTDNDFIPDNIEIKNYTNPLDNDEDSNGIADGLDGDPFFKYQWYLKSLGNDVANTVGISTIIGNDLNILDIYHYTLGNTLNKKLTIQVVDTGVELLHEDLQIDTNLSYNSINHSNDPTPTQRVVNSDPESPLDSGHGTAVAGIVAARTNNGLGVRGIVPRAKIAGSNWLEDETTIELEKVWYSYINSDDILVTNNSWGAYYLKDEAFEAILKLGSNELRNKKGRIYVFASGNFREEFGNSNLSYVSNNPYAITVAAINHLDKYSSYSTAGSNILVSAYGGEHYYSGGPTIMTTALMGKSYHESDLNGRKGVITVDEDSEKNYTYAMNGTSSATPMVSGIIALTLDACPNLTYRDIRWLIANTATKIDTSNTSWVKNSAGLWHSIDYGFGKINGLKMIKMCRSKYYENLPALQIGSVELSNINKIIPDNNTSILTPINFTKDMKIEWVGLTIDSDHPFAGDLEINLISPQGTKISIMTLTETHFAAYDGGFRFSSVAFIDENSAGIWRVEIIDRLKDDYGLLKRIKLEIYGHKK